MKPYLALALIAVCAAPAVLLMTPSQATPSSTAPDPVQRGRYLVAYAGCADCHTPLQMGPNGPEPDLSRYLAGHPEDVDLPSPDLRPGPWFAATAGMTAWAGPWGISYAANLTPDVNTGMGIWTEEMFVQAMRTGKHMGNGRPILPPMPWQNLAILADEDLRAIFAYLKSLPPIVNHVPDPVMPEGHPKFE